MNIIIQKHTSEIQALCKKYGVIRLELFGSAARGDFDGNSSDIDLIASFEKRNEPGYADRYYDFAEALETLFGRKVDLMTPGAILNRCFAEKIKRESLPIYVSKDHQAA